MIKRFLIALIIIGVLVGGLAYFQLVFKPKMIKEFLSSQGAPVATITAEAAKTEEWIERLPAIGTLIASQGVEVASQVAGIVTGLGFESGQDVPVGTKLVQLDISVEQADLASAQAILREADVAFKRQADLLAKSVASEANVDTARAKRDTAEAALNRIKALIAQKAILAPFAGRLGIRHVELGQYISPGLAMVSLQALDPIWVDFPMPEQNVGKLRVGQTIELTVDTFPGKVFTGTVASLDARVSQETRTLLIRGTLANPDSTLLPGMFANVAVLAGRAFESRDRAAHGRHLQPLRRQRLCPEETRGPAGARQAGGHRLRRRAPLREERTGERRPGGHHLGPQGRRAGRHHGAGEAVQRRPRQGRQLASIGPTGRAAISVRGLPMSFTDIFIRRPVLASVVSLLILLIGLSAAFNLQVRQYPELSNTTITVTTTYPGANADVIKGFITVPIQQAVASAEGIDTLSSTSLQSVSTVTLNLRLNADPDRAVADVLSKVNQVRSILPQEAQDPVVVKQTGESTALMYLSFNSDVLTSSQITDYLTRVVQPKLQTVDGVANAQILGGQTFAMRIWLDPNKMAALGITPLQVRTALAANNFTTAAGQIKGDFVQTTINAQTSLDNAEAFGQLVVAARGDALVRLRDIADIALGAETVDSTSAFNGLKAVFIGIYSTPTANPLTVIADVRKTFPSIVAELPPGMTADIAYDSTKFIDASISEVQKTLLEAAVIVIIVIFLFLGSLRSTLIPIVTIPLSLIGVMFALLALGYSLNLLTLLALVLAIGLVVDDAIVVVENIHRHIEEGLSPLDAALVGAREIAVPVISMTITLAAVYAPIGFVSGLTGSLFREFAFTLAGAVIVSGIIALTLSPMMCSKLLSADLSPAAS